MVLGFSERMSNWYELNGRICMIWSQIISLSVNICSVFSVCVTLLKFSKCKYHHLIFRSKDEEAEPSELRSFSMRFHHLSLHEHHYFHCISRDLAFTLGSCQHLLQQSVNNH